MEIQKLDEKINKELSNDFSGGIPYFVQVGPEKWLLPNKYQNEAENFKNFAVRPDDVWMMGYPRSGTTLTQSIIWSILHDSNFESTNSTKDPKILSQVPLFERRMLVTDQALDILRKSSDPVAAEQLKSITNNLRNIEETSTRRVIKTHLPFCLLPSNLLEKGCKIVYIARNPKDVVVSYYHLQRMIGGRSFIGDFEKYFGYLEKNLLCFNPYWEHIKQAWEQRNNKNVLFLFYEDINKNLKANIDKIAKFLGKNLTEMELNRLENQLSFDNFKKNDGSETFKRIGFWKNTPDGFVRKGKSGGWTDYFSTELNKRADKWIEENINKIPQFKLPQ